MKTPGIKVATVAGLVLSVLPTSAFADPTVADKLVATQLFKEGRALLDQGQIRAACQKLAESQRIDPGGGTLLNLALCHEREGRTATAWEEFTEALGVAKRDNLPARIEFARSHIAEIEPNLSRLFVQVPPDADLPDLEIRRDGNPLGRAAWGSAIPVDPGDHVLEVMAPGKVPAKEVVAIGPKGDTKTFDVPVLQNAVGPSGTDEAQAAKAIGVPAHTAPAAALQSEHPTRDGEPSSSHSRAYGSAVPGWVVFGLGVAATGAGTYFAVRAMQKKDDADRSCPSDYCSVQGASDNSDAIKYANFATAGFIAGGVGLGLGTVLLVWHATSSHGQETGTDSAHSILATAANGLSVGPTSAGFRYSAQW